MYARLAEIISLDGSIAVTLAAHQAIGLKVRIRSKKLLFSLGGRKEPHYSCVSEVNQVGVIIAHTHTHAPARV